MKYIICELDNCLCDNSQRVHYLDPANPTPSQWREYHSRLDGDAVNTDLSGFLDRFWEQGYSIVYACARPEEYREATLKWLFQKELWYPRCELCMLDSELTLAPEDIAVAFSCNPEAIGDFVAAGIPVIPTTMYLENSLTLRALDAPNGRI